MHNVTAALLALAVSGMMYPDHGLDKPSEKHARDTLTPPADIHSGIVLSPGLRAFFGYASGGGEFLCPTTQRALGRVDGCKEVAAGAAVSVLRVLKTISRKTVAQVQFPARNLRGFVLSDVLLPYLPAKTRLQINNCRTVVEVFASDAPSSPVISSALSGRFVHTAGPQTSDRIQVSDLSADLHVGWIDRQCLTFLSGLPATAWRQR